MEKVVKFEKRQENKLNLKKNCQEKHLNIKNDWKTVKFYKISVKYDVVGKIGENNYSI